MIGEPDVCCDRGGVGKGHSGRRRRGRNVEDQSGGSAHRSLHVCTAFIVSHLRDRGSGFHPVPEIQFNQVYFLSISRVHAVY